MPIVLYVRCVFGGFLMGLANLVPGISGGTMLLAAGIYPQFITSVANFTSLRFSKETLGVLLCVGCAAAVSILTLAGALKELVLQHRWVMYSLFIGLTLGGVPLLKKLIGSGLKSHAKWIMVGLLLMVAVAFFQSSGAGTGGASESWPMMFAAGVAGAAAMILPGVSGGYLLLLLGVYVPILTGLDELKTGLKASDWQLVFGIGMNLVLPVGLGVLIGIAGVSHILKKILEKFESQTYALLLGVLLGAVFGLWPFRAPLPLESIDSLKGQKVHLVEGELTYTESGKKVKTKDIPTKTEMPTPVHAGGALLIIVGGYLLTLAVSRVGEAKDKS